MKYTQFYFLTIIIFISSLSQAIGQNDWKSGFIIKSSGDSIQGQIDNHGSKTNSKNCYFRLDESNVVEKFTPEQLIGYGFEGNEFFVSKSIKEIESGSPVFLQFLVDGKIDLYHYQDEDHRYFVQKDGQFYEMKNSVGIRKARSTGTVDAIFEKKEYVGTLNVLFQDANLFQEINNAELNSKSLIRLTKKYHERVCPEEICLVFEKEKKKSIISYSPLLGVYTNRVMFGGKKNIYSDKGRGSYVGARLEVESFLQWQNKLSLLIDFTFVRYTNYTLKNDTNNNTEVIYNKNEYWLIDEDRLTKNKDFYSDEYVSSLDVNLKLNVLRVPLSFRYYISKGDIRPYFGLGVVNFLVLSQNKDFKLDFFYNEYNQSVPNYQFGYLGNVGCKFMLANNRSIYTELNYESVTSPNVNEIYRYSNQQLSLTVGYTF